jgi:hypothetical protein
MQGGKMQILLLIGYMLIVSLVVFGAGLVIYRILSFFGIKHTGLSLFLAYSSMVILVALALRNTSGSGFEGLLWIYPLYLGYPANLLSATVQEALGRVFSFSSGMLSIPAPLIMIIYGGLQWFYIGVLIGKFGAFEKRLGENTPAQVKASPAASAIDRFAFILTVIAVIGYFSALAGITFKTMTISLTPGPLKASEFYACPELGKISQIHHFQRNGSLQYRLVGTHGAITLNADKSTVEKTTYNFPPKYYEWEKNAAVFAGGGGTPPVFAVCSPGSGSDLTFFNSEGSVIWQYKFNKDCGSCLPNTIDSGDLSGDGSYTAVCAANLPGGFGIYIPDYRNKKFRLVHEGLFGQAGVAEINNGNKCEIIFSDSMTKEGLGIMDGDGRILKRINNPFGAAVRCVSAAGWFDSSANDKLIFADDTAVHVMDQDGKQLWNYDRKGYRTRVFGAVLTSAKTGAKYFACLLSSGTEVSPSTLIVIDSALKTVFEMQLKGDCPYMDPCGSYALIGADGLVYKLTAGD